MPGLAPALNCGVSLPHGEGDANSLINTVSKRPWVHVPPKMPIPIRQDIQWLALGIDFSSMLGIGVSSMEDL